MHAGGNHPDWFARLAVAIPAALLLVMTGLYCNERSREHPRPSRQAEDEAGLDRMITPIELKDVTLKQTFDAIAAAAQARIDVDWRWLEAGGWDLAERRDVRLPGGRLRDVLARYFEHELGMRDWWLRAQGGSVYISGEPETPPVFTRAYDVQPIIQSIRDHRADLRARGIEPEELGMPWPSFSDYAEPIGPRREPEDQLIREDLYNLILNTVTPVAWRDMGGKYELHAVGERVIATADERTHERLKAVLTTLQGR